MFVLVHKYCELSTIFFAYVDKKLDWTQRQAWPSEGVGPLLVRGAHSGFDPEDQFMGQHATSFRAALMGLASIAALASAVVPADAANKVLKIGFVGVTSGPAAAWGTSNVRSMQTLAGWWNSTGGVKIGDQTSDIDVVTFDDQKDPKGVKTVAFVAANESDPLSQRDNGVAAAKALGLTVVADKDTYQKDTRDFTPVLTPIVKLSPDLLVLSGVAPADAPLLIRSARELGYKGLISTETAQDAKVLEEGAGDLANGFISVGGASTPEIRSKSMEEFIDRYTKKFGEYNDESNTKVYALQYIIDTLKADPKAIDNVDEFKKTIDAFSAPNPYLKDSSGTLHYVGATSFGQKRQLAVPLVVNEYDNGKFKTLFVANVD